MNSFDTKFFGKEKLLPTIKPISKPIVKITPVMQNWKPFSTPINTKPIKGASLAMQKQWKSFSPQIKNTMRMKYPDRDGDRIPDRWDCNPYNPFKTKDMPVIDVDEQFEKTIENKQKEEYERAIQNESFRDYNHAFDTMHHKLNEEKRLKNIRENKEAYYDAIDNIYYDIDENINYVDKEHDNRIKLKEKHNSY